MRLKDAADDFLRCRRIAVTGVSRHPDRHGSNVVYRRLRARGYEVFAVNPNADSVEGDVCFPSIASIDGGVDAVVIGTAPGRAEATVRECIELGIGKVWMHRSMGQGSVSGPATVIGRSHGISVIAGGCPLMFEPAADAGHKLIRGCLALAHRLPA